MKTYTATDLERLVRGQLPPSDVFRDILDDPEAVRELDRLRMVHELFAPSAEDEPDLGDIPQVDVTFAELAQYVDGQLSDSDRRGAVERFLREHFPEALPPEGEIGTTVEFTDQKDTVIDQGAEPESNDECGTS